MQLHENLHRSGPVSEGFFGRLARVVVARNYCCFNNQSYKAILYNRWMLVPIAAWFEQKKSDPWRIIGV